MYEYAISKECKVYTEESESKSRHNSTSSHNVSQGCRVAAQEGQGVCGSRITSQCCRNKHEDRLSSSHLTRSRVSSDRRRGGDSESKRFRCHVVIHWWNEYPTCTEIKAGK